MTSWQSQLRNSIDRQFDGLVELRRHLHRYPELSGKENQTSFRVYQELGDRGFKVSLGPEGCGVIADLTPDDSHRGIFGIRADLAALQIQDEKNVAYKSQCAGVMHACGHDAHTTIVLGALSAIAELHEDGSLPFTPSVRGVFQPAEEICVGAKQMIEVGALDGVEAMIATHVDPTRRLGKIGLREGIFTANCDEVRFKVKGRGGHAARPHQALDPISSAAQLIHSLYLQLPRSVDSLDSMVFTIGTINGGQNANVIPDHVSLKGTLRTLDRKVREQAIQQIERIADSVARGSQTEIEVTYGVSAYAVKNHPTLVNLLETSTTDVLGQSAIQRIAQPSMGSEDFAFFTSEVPAAMFRLGCTSEHAGGAGLHTSQFDIDEEAIRIGAHVMAHAAIVWMERQSSSDSASDPTAQVT